MRIVVDQDQVLALWIERVLEWYNEDFATSITREDIKDYWKTDQTLGPAGKSFLRSCMRYPEMYRDLAPVEGAIVGMKKLIDLGHDVIIATAVPKCAGISYHGKLEWLRREMPFFDLNNFIAVQRKDLISGDLLLDDGPHNVEAWEKTGRQAVVFDCPWNKDVKSTYRVKHWNEFVSLVEDFNHLKKSGLLKT